MKKEIDDLALHINDLLLVRSNGSESLVGRCALVDSHATECAFAGYLVRVRTVSTELHSPYLQLALDTQTARQQIEGPIRTTSGVKNINSTEISNLLLPVPPLAEQKRIVQRVQELMALCDALEAQRETSAEELLEAMVAAILAGGERTGDTKRDERKRSI